MVVIADDERIIGLDVIRRPGRAQIDAFACAKLVELMALLRHRTVSLLVLDVAFFGKVDDSPVDEVSIGLYAASETGTPFGYLTSCSDEKTFELMRESSPEFILLKPFNEKELIQQVELAMRFPRSLSSPRPIDPEAKSKLDSLYQRVTEEDAEVIEDRNREWKGRLNE